MLTSGLNAFKTQANKCFSSLPKNNAPKDSMQYCLDSVRRYDYENFLSTLLLKNSVRTRAITIRAFNVEISRVQDQVSEKSIGLMRFQFWNDAVDKILTEKSIENVPAHPIVHQLYKMNLEKKISKRHLTRLIESRKRMLTRKYFTTLEDLEKYVEESVSPIYYMILEDSGVKNVHADHAASHLGKAQGIVNMLRSVEHSARSRIVTLPQDLLIKYDISQESVLRSSESEKLKEAIFEVASRANQHLSKARSIEVPKDAKRVFLPAIAVDSYLRRLRNRDFSLFDKGVTSRDSLLSFRLYWYNLMSKY